MAVGLAVLAAGDVNPEVLAVGGLKDELVEVGIALQPVKPLAGGFKVSMTLVIIPSCLASERETDISGLSESMLGGIGTTNLHVELVAAVAGADDHGAANKGAKWFKDFFAELLEDRYKLRWYTVINATS